MADMGIKEIAHRMAAHAAVRQSHIARNVANADTPGYRATDINDFAQELDPAVRMQATRPGHIGAHPGATEHRMILRDGEASLTATPSRWRRR